MANLWPGKSGAQQLSSTPSCKDFFRHSPPEGDGPKPSLHKKRKPGVRATAAGLKGRTCYVTSYNNNCETSSSEAENTSSIEAVEAAVANSLTGILPSAPIENRPVIFSMLCRTKAAEVAAVRMRLVDDCWDVACAAGLVAAFSTAVVQGWIVSAFGGAS
jgi:hypothetical protein